MENSSTEIDFASDWTYAAAPESTDHINQEFVIQIHCFIVLKDCCEHSLVCMPVLFRVTLVLHGTCTCISLSIKKSDIS